MILFIKISSLDEFTLVFSKLIEKYFSEKKDDKKYLEDYTQTKVNLFYTVK